MSSVLFQSTGKDSGSSSSTGSLAANPLLALTRFYEQELTDHHIDTRFHGNSKQPISFKRGYPSSSSSYSSSSSPLSYPSNAFNYPSANTSSDAAIRHPYTQKTVQDEFKIFSSSDQSSPPLPPLHPHFHLHPTGAAEMSEYLRQRQEYYAREAHFRSQDRHDGLGPIVDFSEQLWIEHEQQQQQQQQHHHHHHHRLEDHLEARHHNPYARHQQQQQQPLRRQASSQQEQVAMDLGRNAIQEFESVANQYQHHHDLSTMNNTYNDMSQMEQTWSDSYQHFAKTTTATAAASSSASSTIHSPWPMGRWAIEAEAAIMQFEALHTHYERPPQIVDELLQQEAQMKRMISETTATEWSKEFSRASSIANQSQQQQQEKESNTDPSSTMERQQQQQRRKSLKTCGFMWDTKTKLEGHHDLLLDPSDDDAIASFAMEFLSPSQNTFLPHQVETILTSNNVPIPQQQSTTTTLPTSFMEHQYQQLPLLEPLEQRHDQMYNDDVFEGDMLQAWMETLAQEKQEEEVKEGIKCDELDEVEQKVVMEVALRRLNALMHQLNCKQGLPEEKPYRDIMAR
ncbi:hypothetical protein BGZ65_007291 [Modicella reniformis]|uniref:Uncharacterized protein n=1 Tax=Modicella reniformis TaxID=1440133 RepID=A0A9P6J4X1_9FUNG|nr:hypothetical protein BGZ65_007291 [Modicella reniformis]